MHKARAAQNKVVAGLWPWMSRVFHTHHDIVTVWLWHEQDHAARAPINEPKRGPFPSRDSTPVCGQSCSGGGRGLFCSLKALLPPSVPLPNFLSQNQSSALVGHTALFFLEEDQGAPESVVRYRESTLHHPS